jgi:hypothetical protein
MGELMGINFAAVMEQGGLLLALTTLRPEPLELKLHGFDEGGIWVENQKLTDMILELFDAASLPAQPVFFVPYSGIRWACILAEGQSLSSAKLGL